MEKKKYKLSEEDILTKVFARVQNSTSWMSTQVSAERTRVQQYYDGTLPARQSKGNSSYVSSDVYDSIESMKAQLLEVFSGTHDILRFKAINDRDVPAARMETSYVTHLVYHKNKGFDVFSDVIDDSLKGRIGVVQLHWDEEVVRDEHTVTGMAQEDAEALAAQEDVEIDVTVDDEFAAVSTYSGTWTRIIDKSGLRIENVPPEEYYSEGQKKDRRDGVRGRLAVKTRADLIADGYPKAKVNAISLDNDPVQSSEAQQRNSETNDNGVRDEATQKELEYVTLYETYIKLSLNGDGKAALYRVIHASNVLFEIDEVEQDNFVVFTPLRRPHSQFGNNFGKRIVPTQNARTVLTRAILDHTATTVNPRWQVLNGALTNPRELLDNRLRGIVNVKQRDGIAPLQYPNMNPFVFQTLETLKSNKEENTGISSLSQGLNKDAISSQNSAGMVDNLITLSQVRQKIIARNFASFLSEVFQLARKLVLDNESRKRVFEFNEEFVQIDPTTWTPERDVQVSLHIGYGEQEKEAAKYAQLWGMASNDPSAAPFFPLEKKYKLLTDGMKKNGFTNYADYTITPDQVQPPGPDPIEMKKLEIEEKNAQARLMTAQAAAQKVENQREIDSMKVQISELLATVKSMVANRDADRKDIETANRVNVAQRELELAEQVDPVNQKAIFSANS